MVKSPHANAEDTGPIPGPGRLHVLRSSSARLPRLLSPRALDFATSEVLTVRSRASQGRAGGPHSRHRESPRTATEPQRWPKKRRKKKKGSETGSGLQGCGGSSGLSQPRCPLAQTPQDCAGGKAEPEISNEHQQRELRVSVNCQARKHLLGPHSASATPPPPSTPTPGPRS